MASFARPKITVSQIELGPAIRRASEPAQKRLAEKMAAEMLVECLKIVNEKTERRPPDRRKTDTTHLDQSFVARARKIQGQWRAELITKPGVNSKKIGALEHGTKHPYKIAPRNASRLSWQDKSGVRTTLPKGRAVQRNPKPGSVEYEGVGMMRGARDIVVRRHR